MSDQESVFESREFGLSHYDFQRIFPRVWPEHEKINENSVRLSFDAGGQLTITLSEQKVRRLATLRIPYMDIGFQFEGLDENQRLEFYKKFERAFQKGGG